MNPKSLLSKIFCVVIAASASLSALANEKMITNAKIWTGVPSNPWAETIVIRGNKIAAVGNSLIADDYPDAQLIDAHGKLIVPGFIDNHTHFMDGSASLISIGTQSANSIWQFKAIVKHFAASNPAGEWITGGLWDHEKWGGELPDRKWIDGYTKDTPLFLLRTDGHMALANTATLKLAGIDTDTPDPEGGLIVRDKEGRATGVLKDNAMNFVWKVMPPMGAEQAARTFDAGIAEALKNGVTQIHNMSNWDNISIFERAKKEGRLKIRTYYFPHISFRKKLAQKIKEQGAGDAWLRFGGVKELVDGSLGSTTAWFYEPYIDEPDTSGFPLMTMESLKASIQESHELGLQLAIHGIGDRTNDAILDIFEELGIKNQRSRIEHAQHLSEKAIPRFGKLGVIPSMHPYHAIDDGRWAEKRIGADRLQGTYAFKSLLENNAILSFGSDWSVAPLNPIAGIYAAVTRRTIDGKNPDGWVPEQKISVDDALRAYTVNNAWAGKQEQVLGSLEPGKLADLLMLDQNIFEIAPQDIINTQVDLTMIDGEVVYQRK